MPNKPLVKLGFAALIAVAAVIGLGSAPARALDCPYRFDYPDGSSCVFAEEVCNEEWCCCHYNSSNPELACLDYCG
jgi:hypothetical protein